MKTISQHLSNIRALLKAYSRTQEGYTDEGLYSLFSVSRADILKQQFDKFKHVSEQCWQQFCLSLEVGKSHNCDCVPDHLECKVLRSVYNIPTTLTGRNKSKINIRTIGGKVVNLVSEEEWFRKKDKETTDYYGSIINRKLIIWNAPLTLKVILISAIWSDVTELESIPNCDPNGNPQGQCFDILSSNYPLPDEYAQATYKRLFELLNIPLQLPQDQTNDSNESIKM